NGGVVRCAGIVHQIVEPFGSEALQRLSDRVSEVIECAGIADVELQRHSISPGVGDQAYNLARLGFVRVEGENRIDAASCERQHGTAAEPAASASDECDGIQCVVRHGYSPMSNAAGK